jgi:hypothetical protein
MTYAYVNLWLYSIRMDCLRKQILVQNMRALQYCTCNLANTVLAMHYYYHYTLNDYICRYIPNKNALMDIAYGLLLVDSYTRTVKDVNVNVKNMVKTSQNE